MYRRSILTQVRNVELECVDLAVILPYLRGVYALRVTDIATGADEPVTGREGNLKVKHNVTLCLKGDFENNNLHVARYA